MRVSFLDVINEFIWGYDTEWDSTLNKLMDKHNVAEIKNNHSVRIGNIWVSCSDYSFGECDSMDTGSPSITTKQRLYKAILSQFSNASNI